MQWITSALEITEKVNIITYGKSGRMVLPFLLTIHMDEKLMSSTTNDWEKENASQKNKMFKHNPVRFVFAIGFLHFIVSIALSLYALYH